MIQAQEVSVTDNSVRATAGARAANDCKISQNLMTSKLDQDHRSPSLLGARPFTLASAVRFVSVIMSGVAMAALSTAAHAEETKTPPSDGLGSQSTARDR